MTDYRKEENNLNNRINNAINNQNKAKKATPAKPTTKAKGKTGYPLPSRKIGFGLG